MTLWTSAIRSRQRRTAADHLRAAVLTVLVPTLTAVFVLWVYPTGCDIRGDPAVYRWTCLLPGLMLTVPIGAAFLLPAAIFLNDRLPRPLPDGWLVTIFAAGLFTQAVLCGSYLVALDPAYRRLFLAEVIFIPQPLVAGAIAGAVYWGALHWGRRG